MSMDPQMDPAVVTCGNCHSPMPRELRFCRSCGFRLGEGVAEYTETVRFQNAPPRSFAGIGSQPNQAGAMSAAPPGKVKKRRRMSGMTWMFLGLLLFFVVAAGISSIVSVRRRVSSGTMAIAAPRSYVGVDGFDETEGGVTFDDVEPPNSPADKAGLLGGDIITSFDGKPVTDEDDLTDIVRKTPVGKTVDVVYIRDGETKTTKLTTISKEELDRLNREFANRPEGRGRLGYDRNAAETVDVPGTKIRGVQLNGIDPSLPADMAGMKPGDIVVEFDGVPIRTPGELTMRVRRAKPYETVNIAIVRENQQMEIPVRIGRQ